MAPYRLIPRCGMRIEWRSEWTEGALGEANQSDYYIFIIKNAPDRTHQWTKQYGNPNDDNKLDQNIL